MEHFRCSYEPTVMRRVPQKNISYDTDSGLVYSEFEVSGRGSRGNWISDYRTPSIVRTRLCASTGTGVRSLAQMALAKLGIESRSLTVETLQMLPWSIGERIWQQIVEEYACTCPRSGH